MQDNTCNSKFFVEQITAELHTETNDTQAGNRQRIEQINMALLFLATKYALTGNKKYAHAAYRHVCLLNEQFENDQENKFLCQSLAMDWHAVSKRFEGLNF